MVNAIGKLVALGAIAMLAGCGDSGGGMVTSVSKPAGPTTNTTLANLVASQSFANSAATATDTIAASANVTAASSTSQALTFSYDLASNSYTVSTQGRSQTFAPANQASASGGIAVYSITSGATTDRLTLESASVTGYGSTSPQYSGLGYWQHTVTGSGSSDVSVDFFIYGLPSTSAQVPRTGNAAYATSVYGLVSPLGTEARFFQGTGRLDVDFLDGLVSTSATLGESGIVSQSNYGSGASLNGSGTLSSSANAFSGTMVYTGINSKSSGTLSGQFYGPSAQEVGASFTSTGLDGSSATGVIWGNENASLTPINQTVTTTSSGTSSGTSSSAAPVTTQSYTAQGAQMVESTTPTASIAAGAVSISSDGGAVITPSGLGTATVTSSNTVTTANANFAGYSVTDANGTIAVSLYKPGSGNTELALTYMSFGSWQGPATAGSSTPAASWFAYGVGTAASIIQARTGQANYTGVAYGTAFNSATNTSAAVTGTATFAINFPIQGYSGTFGLKSATTDYGTFNTTGVLSAGVAQAGGITGTTAGTGTFKPAFYGPTGQEFGGPFTIAIPSATTTIVGVAAGKGG